MSNSNNMHKYDDIINLPHYTSSKRPRMAMIDRAAQFSPFAALTGYDAADLAGKTVEYSGNLHYVCCPG